MDRIPFDADGKKYIAAMDHGDDGSWAVTTMLVLPAGKLLIVDQQAGTRETQLSQLIDELAAAKRIIIALEINVRLADERVAEVQAQLDVAHLMLGAPKGAEKQ